MKKDLRSGSDAGHPSQRAGMKTLKKQDEAIPVKQILITDDEDALRDLLASQLQQRGYKCISLASKSEAYRWSLEHKPDLIITDINSPGMDGFQFLRLVKGNTSIGKVPVVFLTGVASNETEAEAKRLGADEFVTKPCTLAQVQSVVERVLATPERGVKSGAAKRPPGPAHR